MILILAIIILISGMIITNLNKPSMEVFIYFFMIPLILIILSMIIKYYVDKRF